MKGHVDCILAAYSGLDKNCEKYKHLVSKKPSIKEIPIPLNAAIAYLATSLDEKELSFDFINAVEHEEELLLKRIEEDTIKCVGISTTICSDIYQLKDIVNKIKKIDDQIKIILGGALIVNYVRNLRARSESVFQFSMRSLHADYIIDSIYGEDIFAQVVYQVKNGLSSMQIPDLYYRENGQFHLTYHLDKPYVLNESKVNWNLFKGRTGNMISMRTSVSCYFNCMFCSYPVRAGEYQSLDVSQIEENLNQVEQLKEVSLIQFVDDTFNVPLNRYKEILKTFIKNKYHFQWFSYLRCQALDDEAARLMKESGCIGVFLGLESGSDQVLKSMNKMVKVTQYEKGITLLKKYGIPIVASFFCGFPGETRETMDETERFIKRMKPDFYYLGTWIYDERTPIYQKREEYGLTGTESKWKHNTMDSDEAHAYVKKMKQNITESILVEDIDYPFLFQMVHTSTGLEELKEFLRR